MWSACVEDSYGTISKFHNLPPDSNLCIYFCGKSSTTIPNLVFDPLNYFLQHGCHHLIRKILSYLDSSAILAASMVSIQW